MHRMKISQVRLFVFHFMLLECSNYIRDEPLDELEAVFLNILKEESEHIITIFLNKRELRRSARAVAIRGLEKINGALFRGDNVAVREYVKETLIAWYRLCYGSDIIDLIEEKT